MDGGASFIMALIDTLEALAALYNKGAIDLLFMACIVHAKTICQLLEWCKHFDIELNVTDCIKCNMQNLEHEYHGWRVWSKECA